MTPAEAEIRARIAAKGKISFAEFMGLALYHPRRGYYTSPSGIGASGDYYTSPSAHPAFGALIGLQLHRMWQLLDQPSPFYVVELGAGTGRLAGDIMDYAERLPGEFASAVRYVALDRYAISPAHEGVCRVVSDTVPLRGVVGCFLSNEFFDALPVHRFTVQDGVIQEIYVTLDSEGSFMEVLDTPSTGGIEKRLSRLGRPLPEGFKGEVCLKAAPWLRAVSSALEKGFALSIDYGHEAAELYSEKRSRGTLQTYYRHTTGASPYQRVGRQDITAHVDFSLLAEEGRQAGLAPVALESQAEFLKRLGLEAALERVRLDSSLGQVQRRANIAGMLDLVSPEGLGSFKALIQEKEAGVASLAELTAVVSPTEVGVPLLTGEHAPLARGGYPHAAWDFSELWPFGGEAEKR